MIQIKCETKDSLPLEELTNLQGDLKTLSKENAEKLKKQIRDNGFIVPFFVWRNGETNYILDGHQRQDVLRQMEADGEEIPERFPVVYVEADDMKDAKKKLLAINSQYGKMTEEGLFNFIEDIDFQFDVLEEFELNIERDEKEKVINIKQGELFLDDEPHSSYFVLVEIYSIDKFFDLQEILEKGEYKYEKSS